MRFFSLIVLMLLWGGSIARAQVIDAKENLFNLSGFFHTTEIKKHKIKSITISKSNKEDGKIFKSETSFLNYNFSTYGNLILAEKYVQLRNKVDTVQLHFFYNDSNKLSKKIEKQGPFQFVFYYYYNNFLIHKEVKQDGKSPNRDTAYVRFFKHHISTNQKKTSVLNSLHKPFQEKIERTNKQGEIIEKEVRFTHNSNYHQIIYSYSKGVLKSKNETSYFGETNKSFWKYSYKEKKLDKLLLRDDQQDLKKYAILYETDLPSAIIERNILEKEVIVYKIRYSFYN